MRMDNEDGNTTYFYFLITYAVITEKSKYEKILKSYLGIKLTIVFRYS